MLVGAGKLGRALLDFDGFEEFGIQIVAGFDCNEQALQIGPGKKNILSFKDIQVRNRSLFVTMLFFLFLIQQIFTECPPSARNGFCFSDTVF